MVERLAGWRKKLLNEWILTLSQNKTKGIVFYWKNKSILDQLLKDLMFLPETVLAKYIKFSKLPDPLLVYAMQDYIKSGHRKPKIKIALHELFNMSE